MRVIRVIADLPVDDVEEAKGFYADFLGLTTEEFNLGWVARLTSPQTGAHLQIVAEDATAPERPVVSVLVDDVDAAYELARACGYEIVHPLCDEEWGVRRFYVRAPDGNVINLLQHRE